MDNRHTDREETGNHPMVRVLEETDNHPMEDLRRADLLQVVDHSKKEMDGSFQQSHVSQFTILLMSLQMRQCD